MGEVSLLNKANPLPLWVRALPIVWLLHIEVLPYNPLASSTGCLRVCNPKNTKVHVSTLGDTHTRRTQHRRASTRWRPAPTAWLAAAFWTPSMLCAQDQLWRRVTGPPPAGFGRAEIQHWHTAETAEQEFEESCGKGEAEWEEATMRRACRNTLCGMNGMASEASERACRTSVPRLASLCSLLPRTRLGRDEMKKKRNTVSCNCCESAFIGWNSPEMDWDECRASSALCS